MPSPGDYILTVTDRRGIFIRFKSYVHGDMWNAFPGATLDLGKPIAGKYFFWDDGEIVQCITGDMLAEVRVLSGFEENEDDSDERIDP